MLAWPIVCLTLNSLRQPAAAMAPDASISPEAFIDLSSEPGKESTWRITYQFYQVHGS